MSIIVCILILNYGEKYQQIKMSYIPKLEPLDSKFNITKRAYNELGWVDREFHNSDYYNFSQKKPKGIIRIGVFGGSFAAGSEVEPNQDLASHLNKLLNQESNKYEVLNFGVGAYGLSQSFRLWKELHDKYELDNSIFYIPSWHLFRDASFVFNYLNDPNNLISPVHLVYRRDGESLKKVELPHESRIKNIENYYSFFPSYNFLKYDYFLPPFLQLKPVISSRLREPLKYLFADDFKTELLKVYSLIFREVAKIHSNFKIISNDESLSHIVDKERYIIAPWLKYIEDSHSLYMSKCCHLNTFFQNDLAKVVIGTTDVFKPHQLQLKEPTIVIKNDEIKNISSVYVSNNELLLLNGHFIEKKKWSDLHKRGIIHNKQTEKIKSLYIVKRDKLSTIEIIPSSISLQTGDVFFKNSKEKFSVGRIRKVTKNLGVIEFDSNKVTVNKDNYLKTQIEFSGVNNALYSRKGIVAIIKDVESGRYLTSLDGHVFQFRSQIPQKFSSMDSLKKEKLVLEIADGENRQKIELFKIID